MGRTSVALAEAYGRLRAGVEGLSSGDDWRRMLELASRFHSYSAQNVLLILAQRPDARRVAGYRTWRQLGRQVRAGERGIAIVAPCVGGRHGTGGEDRPREARAEPVVSGFRVVHVFDETQTDGPPLPELVPRPVTGCPPAGLWEGLATHLDAVGYRLVRADCSPANGTTDHRSRTVVVRPDLGPAQSVRTLAHEVAHTMLHRDTGYLRERRSMAEVEAESVAFLVCAAARLSTDSYSFPYVALWAGGDAALVEAAAGRSMACARALVAELAACTALAEVGFGGQQAVAETAAEPFVDTVDAGAPAASSDVTGGSPCAWALRP